MNKQLLMEHLRTITSPAFLIGAAVVIGLVLNIYIFTLVVIPPFNTQIEAEGRINTLLQQQASVSRSPIPMKASDEDVYALLQQVPVKDEMPRFYLSLKEFERLSGVSLISIQYADGAAAQSSLEALLSGAAAGNFPSSGGQTPSGSASSGTGSPANQATASIEEINITVDVTGTFSQVSSFIRQLDQSSRLIFIREWTLLSGNSDKSKALQAGQPAASVPIINESDSTVIDKVTVGLKLSLFTAAGYAGKFTDLPPLTPKEVERRSDPTWTEEQFLKLLQSKN